MIEITIADRRIGPGHTPFVIAELGINHNGDPETALRMIDAAVDCGADAIKLQTFDTGKFLARSSAYFEMLRSAELPRDSLPRLVDHARRRGATLFSAVFDEESADLWRKLDAPAFKIASGDVTHLPLLRHVARLGRPMIVSTGGATMAEIELAVATIRQVNLGTPLALLHCVSNYPTEPSDANLACLATIRSQFGVPVGFSDHTIGAAVAVAAVALGASIIEKHFTLDRGQPGPDHNLSADPAGMTALIADIRAAHQAIGRVAKAPVEAPDFIPLIRRSVTAAVDIPAGVEITRAMLAVKRPGTGLAPDMIGRIVGKRARRAIGDDTQVSLDDIAD